MKAVSLRNRDRRLLLAALGLILVVIVVLAVLSPAQVDNDPTPSSYGAGNWGAKAAYLTLERAGYHVERWDGSLSELANRADQRTLLILANPYVENPEATRQALTDLLHHGARILATGASSARVVPGIRATYVDRGQEECSLVPVSFDRAAVAEHVRMHPEVFVGIDKPQLHVQYTCLKRPAVLTYAWEQGHVEWWADPWPLQNQGISQADNLQFLLAAIGSPSETQIYWDESLHGETPSLWSYASGTPFFLCLAQLAFVAGLLLFSFGRRSGPLRPDPLPPRGSPMEFVASLGGLFHKAHTSGAAVSIAYQQIRRFMNTRFAIPLAYSADEAVRALEKRIGNLPDGFAQDLQTAGQQADDRPIAEPRALALVQALDRHNRELST